MKFLLLGFIPVFFGCVSVEHIKDNSQQGMADTGYERGHFIESDLITKETSPGEASLNLEGELPEIPKEVVGSLDKNDRGSIPIEVNANVQKWINYFADKNHARFQRFLNRGHKYQKAIYAILDEYEVPRDIYYLAMIESGFVTRARSHASAVGVWQFIAATGRRYGLKKNYYMDERQDPLRATRSAARYLKDLHRVFDSWYLAMAAYNAGEMRILQSIMKANSRNFWEIVEKKALPRETMNYVPKFLAASIIGHNPEKYGFKITTTEVLPEMKLVDVPRQVKLSSIARSTGVPLSILKKYNGHLKRKMTPSGRGGYGLWVPVKYSANLASAKGLLSRYRVKGARQVASHTSSHRLKKYRVRRGDTLGKIARKYGLSIRKLKKMNGLRSNNIMVGKRLKVSRRSSSYARSGSSTQKYRVRRGDTLGKVARRHGMSIRSLKRLNNLRSNNIMIGQRLKVLGGRSSLAQTKKYKVRRGDSLYKISKKFGLTIKQLKRMNSMRRNTVRIGQVIKVSKNRKG